MKVVSKKYKGFTLIEIIVVIAILAILSTIIII
ncbi:TPA: prepilin-type N-terminal cleavage/methylation domain-containing protein, partial [bacterium]|nr:prepilin-type N-terminal cleavage/methylation domain-containing protein [bacterium]